MGDGKRVAVVTGANRGIGLETCRQLAERGMQVVLTSRDEDKGREAAEAMEGEVTAHQLDVTDDASVARLSTFLSDRFERLDVLVNNAGVVMESYGQSLFDTDLSVIHSTVETNALGAVRCCKALVPLMKTGGYGRVVNISSGMGQLADMAAGTVGYRMSKAALNALTRLLSAEVEGDGIKVNAVCPGWVRTDLGGPNATRSVDEAVDCIVWLATLRADGPTGGFFRDCKAIPW